MFRRVFTAAVVALGALFAWLHNVDYRPVVEQTVARAIGQTNASAAALQ